MKTTLRKVARHVFGLLTRLTVKKHKPNIICILGDGETSIAREILYENIHQKYPARRNLEILEAEFSIPLTVLGTLNYPTNIINWIFLIVSSLSRLIYLKPYKHFLIIEIPEINRKITKFWINNLSPQYILIEGESGYVPKQASMKIYKNPQEILKILGIKENIKEIPQPRIRILKGMNNETIIDATSYYTPPPITAVLELVEKESFGNIILLSNSKEDKKAILKMFPKALINPVNIKIHPEDIVIKRGNKKYP